MEYKREIFPEEVALIAFLASKDRSMLIPFCSKIEVAGRACTRFWRKIQPVFSRQTKRHRPFESHKPRTTFADKKGIASVSLSSHIVEHWKRSKSATLVVKNRKGGYLKMRDNHQMK